MHILKELRRRVFRHRDDGVESERGRPGYRRVGMLEPLKVGRSWERNKEHLKEHLTEGRRVSGGCADQRKQDDDQCRQTRGRIVISDWLSIIRGTVEIEG